MTTYINFYGAPGSGKSTLAAGVFYELKRRGISCELVTEVAKALLWEDRTTTLANQPYVDCKQYRNLSVLKGKVDFVVTDAPLLKGLVYTEYYGLPIAGYETFLTGLHQSLGSHVNFLVTREHTYEVLGREQVEEEAEKIEGLVKKQLETREQEYQTVTSRVTPKELVYRVMYSG